MMIEDKKEIERLFLIAVDINKNSKLKNEQTDFKRGFCYTGLQTSI